MQRNLFNFTAFNSFKIVWAISVVLFTCVIASAQVGQMGKYKAVASCIENFRIVGYKPDSITVSFTTSKPLSTRVRSLNRWQYGWFTTDKAWVRADNIGNNELRDYEKKDHLFTIPVMGTITVGKKFQLVIDASNYEDDDDRMLGCSKVFTVYDPKLVNLRLKGPKPKP